MFSVHFTVHWTVFNECYSLSISVTVYFFVMEQSTKKKLSGFKFRQKALEKKKENERTSAYFHNWLGNTSTNTQCSTG